jgi:hypothetical protein
MNFRKIQPEMQSFDEIDELIRWALLDEVASEEPSPRVWKDIKAKLMLHSQALPSQSGAERLWRRFASALQAWTLGIFAPLNPNLDSRLASRERSYLIWRETLLLSMMPMAVGIVY